MTRRALDFAASAAGSHREAVVGPNCDSPERLSKSLWENQVPPYFGAFTHAVPSARNAPSIPTSLLSDFLLP